MTGQKNRAGAADFAKSQGVRGYAPRRFNTLFADVFQTGQIVDSRTANDADNRRSHVSAPASVATTRLFCVIEHFWREVDALFGL